MIQSDVHRFASKALSVTNVMSQSHIAIPSDVTVVILVAVSV